MKIELGSGLLLIPALTLLVLLGLSLWHFRGNHHAFQPAPTANVKVPLLMSSEARTGKATYDRYCRTCHGANAGGSSKGPSLILYGRAHHGDGAFRRAVRHGVKAHHWDFGDMQPVTALRDKEISQIVQYVRELQQANDTENETEQRTQ